MPDDAATPLFTALIPGLPAGAAFPQSVHDLGTLQVRSGRLEASDPYVSLGQGLVVPVPPGAYPVAVTVCDVSAERDGSHEREAYLSVVVRADLPAVSVREVVPEGHEPAPEGEFYGVGVDAGTVGFTDADAIADGMPEAGSDWYEDVFDNDEPDSWFDLQDDPAHLRAGCANVPMPRSTNGANVVLAHSGWGDGFYPLATTHAADGTLVAVHIDLQVQESAAGDRADGEGAAGEGAAGEGAAGKGAAGKGAVDSVSPAASATPGRG